MFRTKLIRPETKVIDAGAGRIEATVSNESEDRDGDIIRAGGWELQHFQRHPVLLSSHDYMSLRSQIGEWEKMGKRGDALVGTARYYIGEGNEEADWGFKLAQQGRAAYSVGFIPLEYEEREAKKGYDFKRQELLEVSHVTVPSNRDALQLVAKAGHPLIAEVAKEILGPGGSGSAEGTNSNGTMMIWKPDWDGLDEEAIAARIWERLEAYVVRGPIPAHDGPKADEGTAWDAGAQLRQAEGRAQLRRMHAWVDAEDDPENKGAYKLPHHQASGEVVLRGAQAAMGALLGARGGVDIPDGDRRGVYRHLARHYAQFDREPPEFRSWDIDSLIGAAIEEVTNGRRR